MESIGFQIRTGQGALQITKQPKMFDGFFLKVCNVFLVKALHVVQHVSAWYIAGQVVGLCFHRAQERPPCTRRRAHGDCQGEGRELSEPWFCPSHGEFGIFFQIMRGQSFSMAHACNSFILPTVLTPEYSAFLTTFQLSFKRLRLSASESKLPGDYFMER